MINQKYVAQKTLESLQEIERNFDELQCLKKVAETLEKYVKMIEIKRYD